MEILACIVLLAVVAITAAVLVAWRRPERKVMAMLVELVRDSHNTLTARTARNAAGDAPQNRGLPRHLAAEVAARHARQEATVGRSMAEDLDAQTEGEEAPKAEQPREMANF